MSNGWSFSLVKHTRTHGGGNFFLNLLIRLISSKK